MDFQRFVAKALHSEGLIGLYLQNQMSGAVSYDFSKYRRHGALIGVTHRQPSVPGLYMPSTGFDGVNDFNNIHSAGLANDNLLSNPGFETAGAGDPDFWDDWVESAGTGALANETVEKHEGNDAAKVTAGSSANTSIYQPATVVSGAKYRIRFWTRGDGTHAGRYGLYDEDNAEWIVGPGVTTGISSATYGALVKEFTAPAGCTTVRLYLQCPSTDTAVAYFDACEVRSMDGFLGDEGTLLAWAKVANEGVLTDGLIRMIVSMTVDGSNFVDIRKTATNNLFGFFYGAGGVQEVSTPTLTTTDFFCMALTWSKSADAYETYVNGTPFGSLTTLGTWLGDLDTLSVIIGAVNTASTFPWSGNIGPVLAFNEAKSPAEMAYLSTP